MEKPTMSTASSLKMLDQSDNVPSHGPIGVEGGFLRFRGSTEGAEIGENHSRICSEECGDNPPAPFRRRIGQGRSSAEGFDKKLLPLFQDWQNSVETSKLPKGINSITMQKNDRKSFALVMVSDGGSIEGCESFQYSLRSM
jgi:hypothetical protein